MPQVNIGNVHIEWGYFNKRTVGHHVNFARPFADVPQVVLAPHWWRGPVGGVETLDLVQPGFFTVRSGNAAWDYFVHWIAIGFI